ncbi:MaoC/PaaZ C-terminal domain-containing protein [Streptosporangium sp. NPDC000239]|uniref:MaoC/PaaZ C-terminal domain-containing protein n=1 Tax=Streptosporangium jomthongense TaxID=1193683 RepID=A0ABV8EWN0_9ACTN
MSEAVEPQPEPGWEIFVCDEWRARVLQEITGLYGPPYADGNVPCLALLPPTFLVAHRTDPDAMGVPDAPVRLNAGNWCRWEAPVTPGEILERRTVIESVTTKPGRDSDLTFYQLATTYRRRMTHDVVARTSTTTIRTGARQGRGGSGHRTEPPADAVPVIEVTPSSREVVRYAAATDDFYEVHYDHAFARARGLPGTITHGLLKLAYLARAAVQWGGHGTFVRELSASYRGMDRVGAPFRVLARADDGDGDGPSRHLTLYGVSADGGVSTVGRAVIERNEGEDGQWLSD